MSELNHKLVWLTGIRLLVMASVAIPYYLYQLSVPVEKAEELTSISDREEASAGSDEEGREPSEGALAPHVSERERLTGQAEERLQRSERRQREAQARELREKTEQELRRAQVMKILVAVVSVQTLLYIALLRVLRRHPQAQAYVHFAGDLLLITLLIYELSEAASNFSLLYVFVISVAAVLLRRSAAVLVATFAFLLYAAVEVAPSVLAPVLNSIRALAVWGAPLLPPTEGRLTSVPLTYDLGVHLLGFYGVAILTSFLARNVTQAEERLREQLRDLTFLQVLHRDVLQSISSGLVAIDLQGFVNSVNRAGEEVLGQAQEELQGMHVTAAGLFSQEQWEEETRRAMNGGKGRSELTFWRGEERIYIGFSLTLLRDGEGQHRGYLWIFQDLTEWRKLEEQVRIKDRMAAIGEMAAGLAHEVGNPLAAISGSVQVLASTMRGTASQRKLLEITLKESQRLDRTVKGFLQMAHPRQHHMTELDIAALLAEDIALLRNSGEVRPDHRIRAELDPPSVMILADPDQISQVFWNLARNALQAMPEGGELVVSGSLIKEHYHMHFRDTGSGMTEEEKAKLFHPFKTFFDQGTGLGMAIVYRIVEEHDGTILVDSEPGRGSTIQVKLPLGGPATTVHSGGPSS